MGYTEDEQLGELRSVLMKYGVLAVVVIIICVAIVLGWRGWKSHQSSNFEKTSTVYEQLVERIDRKDDTVLPEADAFVNQHHDIYGVMLGLNLTKHYVEAKEYDKAQQMLTLLEKTAKDPEQLSIVRLRLARVMYQQNQLDDALSMLDKVTSESYALPVNSIRGDIFVAKKAYSQAIEAYNKALLLVTSDQNYSRDLRLKINDAKNVLQQETANKK